MGTNSNFTYRLLRVLVNFLMLVICMCENGDLKAFSSFVRSFELFVSNKSSRYRRSLEVSCDSVSEDDLPF